MLTASQAAAVLGVAPRTKSEGETVNRIDQIEILIAHLLCADSDKPEPVNGGRRKTSDGAQYEEVDAGKKLAFDPMRPRMAYTCEGLGRGDEEDGRIYAQDASLLLHSVQDLLGRQAEIALICEDRVKWSGFRQIYKAPRGIWIASPGATLYEVHYRESFPNGASTYSKRVAAISRSGRPVPCVVVGSSGSESTMESKQAVLAASIIEDSLRPEVFRATITDAVGIALPVPQGEHLDVFKLRDGPYSGSRRKALLHWVASHIRRTPKNKIAEIKEHLRGVREFSIDGMHVKLEAPE